MAKEYTVQAYTNAAHIGKWLEVEQDGFSNIKEAKARAKYYLTADYQRASESSERLGYARVLLNGDCVADFTN